MSDLKLYRARLKTRARIMREIPREQQGWWADVCAGKTLELRDATEADIERCNLGKAAPRDPSEYLCENIERGSLVRRIAVAELTEITPRGLVAQHNETNALRARIKELEDELARRTQPEATAPAPWSIVAESQTVTLNYSFAADLLGALFYGGLHNPEGFERIKQAFAAIMRGEKVIRTSGNSCAPEAQDLSAAILALESTHPSDKFGTYDMGFYACRKAAAALASSADALSAGGRVDVLIEALKLARVYVVKSRPALTLSTGEKINQYLSDLAMIDDALLQSKGVQNG